MADILTGREAPSGKLTMSFPIKYGDVPSAANFPLKGDTASLDTTRYEEELLVGYRYYDTMKKPVSYPFGYGLCYTQFEYGNLEVDAEGDSIRVSALIANVGEKEGKEVAQLYISSPDNDAGRPLKELKAFTKTRLLQPCEAEKITFVLPKSELAQYDEEAEDWKLKEGSYRLFVNSSVEDCRLEGKVQIGAKNSF